MRKDSEDALARAYDAGLAAEETGDLEEAARRFRQCLSLDPADHGGAAIRLAAMGRGPAPDRAAPAYVKTLFDQHADAFERILVDDLGYRTPWDIAATLKGMSRDRFADVLDLGCGTGLLGEALEGRFKRLEGVDLSPQMLEIAAEKELYHALHHDDAQGFLARDSRGWSLIAAADVLPYLGDLAPLFTALTPRLASEGVFIASCETLPDDKLPPCGWRLGRDRRFHHGRPYLERTLEEAGLSSLGFAPIVVRMERGEPAHGWLFAAGRAGTAP